METFFSGGNDMFTEERVENLLNLQAGQNATKPKKNRDGRRKHNVLFRTVCPNKGEMERTRGEMGCDTDLCAANFLEHERYLVHLLFVQRVLDEFAEHKIKHVGIEQLVPRQDSV